MGFGYRGFAAVILLPVIFLIAAAPAFAEKRVALIIGNGAYKNAAALPNPRNDAQDVAAALTRTGFEVIVGLDLDRAGMDDHAVRFARAAREADVAIFYYSGHAMQFAGVNYLMPVDARLNDEADLRRMAKIDDIVADLQQAKNLRILVLDSCRDNPLAEDLKRSIGRTRAAGIARGLAKIDSPQGMIVAYATQAGRTADDGSGRNSPYTAAFLKYIEAQEEIGTVFRRVSADVFEATKRAQLPELSLSLIGEFYLKGRPQISVPAAPASAAEVAMVWSATKDTTSIPVLEAFVARYGDSFHANLARARIEELKKTQTAAVVPPVQPAAPPQSVQPAVGVFPTSRAAKPLTPDEERALKPKNSFKECDTCPEMVVVPAGSFTMGSPESENSRHKYEGPQHRVTFAKAFAVGRFAVTFAEWDACVAGGGCKGHKPSDEGWGRGKRPVIDVNWNDAKAYVAWLSRKAGKTYRLLSEAEREYVTRAGTTTPFWMGATISASQANYNGNYTYDNGQKGEYRQRTVPVDSFAPNPWGLYQVHGNIKEWTEDCWNEGYRNAPADGSAWTSGDCGRRVVRSGNWSDPAWPLRAASRLGDSVSTRINSFGFRVARTLAAPGAPAQRSDASEAVQQAAVVPPSQPAVPPSPVQPAVGIFPSAPGVTPLSPERERALKPKNSFKECEVCPEMVVVPAGSFTMGSPEGEAARLPWEGPQHRVTFARQFAVGRFAVTFDEWEACVAGGGCKGYKPLDEGHGRGRRPVINVNWDEAKAYVAWLSRKTGRTYRLLSEAEREYVTRAGTTTTYWTGSSISTSQANYNGNLTSGEKYLQKSDKYLAKTAPVDSFAPNPWGLYQVHGNVNDWVEDCFDLKRSYNGAPTDRSAWTSGDCSLRGLRGGYWGGTPGDLCSAYRNGNTPGSRRGADGLRVARSLAP